MRPKYSAPVLALLLSLPARAAPAAPERPVVELPVREVTVFSDRARVVRRAPAPPGAGVRSVRLPFLPVAADPATVRLEATGAKVLRVEVRRSTEASFPRTEALDVLRKLEAAQDELAAIDDAIEAREDERQVLLGIRPSAAPQPDPKAPPVVLDPTGWAATLAFLDARAGAAETAVAPLLDRRRAKAKEVAELAERAAQLAAANTGTPGWEPEALLEGGGASTELRLSYMAAGARWLPTYDVRYSHGEGQVDVELSGLVSQETGEDWTEARLVLSTAIPATATALPKLPVWKIGQRERFIPTPIAEPEPAPPRPPPPPPIVMTRPPAGLDDDQLRQALREAVVRASEAEGERAEHRALEAPHKPVVDARRRRDRPSAPPPPPPRGRPGAPAPAAMPQAMPAPMEEYEDYRVMAEASPAPSRTMSMPSLGGLFRSDDKPSESVSFGAPRGWRPPVYAADLPAALAGGYDFVYPSARAETVRSGAEARRVALHARRFPAAGLVRILPALSKQAYLVAEVVNDGDLPLLKGAAHLFVGADLVGDAVVPTTAKGEKVTLPLGVDDAVRVERNVNVIEGEKGFISKDDVSTYEVVIEVLNPRSRAVTALVVDQIPLSRKDEKRAQETKIALVRADPAAQPDPNEGFLEWRFELAPGAKKTVRFAYSVTRPKNAKLQQYVERAGRQP